MVLYFRVLQPIQLARLSVHTLTSNKFDALAFAKCAAPQTLQAVPNPAT
jgi:hypothetical protein